MWPKTLILVVICLLNLFPGHYLAMRGTKGHRSTGESLNHVLYAQAEAAAPAKNDGARLPETAEPDPEMERKEPNANHTRTQPEPGKKSPPLKDFVPSEEIEADKAVDFPTDI
jgi:hypothetical protein